MHVRSHGSFSRLLYCQIVLFCLKLVQIQPILPVVSPDRPLINEKSPIPLPKANKDKLQNFRIIKSKEALTPSISITINPAFVLLYTACKKKKIPS